MSLLLNKNAWAYDWENYPNGSTLVARLFTEDAKTYQKFEFSEWQNDWEEFLEWLATRPFMVGYYSLPYDGQITEHVYRYGRKFSPEFIWDFVQKLPISTGKSRFDVPYSEWDFSLRQLDLMTLNHYDRVSETSSMTSLKWLEFTMRLRKLKDLPVPPGTMLSKSKMVDLMRYNTNDVDATYEFALKCDDMLVLRNDLAQEYRQKRIFNMSDSSIGSYLFENILIKEHGFDKRKLKKGSHYKQILGKDILLPYVRFKNDCFNRILDTFDERVYRGKDGGELVNVKDKQYTQEALFEDMVFVYGSGGLHACYSAGEWNSTEEDVIVSVDVASYYPNLAIVNRLYPKHIGEEFCEIYRSVYERRKSFPKGTSMNYALKIALNSVYGKSNDKHSLFYDIMYLLKITVNGQLLLTMLAEALAPLGRLLLVNTDGLEIRIPRSKLQDLRDICGQWELLTGLELEEDFYSKIVVRDVNNYLAINTKGKAKRKGYFELYEDIKGEGSKRHFLHKDPSANVIKKALFQYYANDIPLADTIYSCNDIHEFCFGIKKQKGFDHWLITSHDTGVIDIDKNTDRVLRYFISPEGANIFKFWKDGRKNNITGINRGQLVSPAATIMKSDIVSGTNIRYDVDKEYYLSKAQDLVDLVSNKTKDTAYLRYRKNHPDEFLN